MTAKSLRHQEVKEHKRTQKYHKETEIELKEDYAKYELVRCGIQKRQTN